MKIYKYFLFFAIFFSGCQFMGIFSPIVTGIIIWKEGRCHKYYELDKKVIVNAVRNTCKDLDFKIISEQKSRNGYTITAKNKDNFYFYIDTIKANITDLSLRINTFGNKSYTEMIIHKVDENINLVNYDVYGYVPQLTNFSTDVLTKNP